MRAEKGEASGIPEVPDGVQPHPWLTELWRAWWTLHYDRPQTGGGMGEPIPGRIPWRDQVLWCELHPHVDLDVLTAVTEAMDRVYLQSWADDAKRRAKEQERRDQQRRATRRGGRA